MQIKIISRVMIVFAACLIAADTGLADVKDLGGQSNLKVYGADNILRNGDFQKKGLNLNFPLFWQDFSGQSELPSDRELYSLQDGTLRFESPLECIMQDIDFTTVTAWNYTFSFQAEVEAGTLKCSVLFNYNTHPPLVIQEIKSGKGFQEHSFSFKLNPEVSSGVLTVIFTPVGQDASVKLRKIVLKPVLPQNKEGAKEIYISDAGKDYSLRGLVMAEKHSYYDLRAAEYLRKYLYVSFGRLINIYIGDEKDLPQREKGLIFFGNSFVADDTLQKVKAGGYAVTVKDGNITVGGKDDGAVHGAFAILSGMGMENFTFNLEDFVPASDNVINFVQTTTIRNPSFAYRYMKIHPSSPVSPAPNGESCHEIYPNTRYIGQSPDAFHSNAVLVDPVIYKDHPEYCAMDQKGHRRDWQEATSLMRDGGSGAKTVSMSANASVAKVAAFRQTMQLCLSNPDVQKIATETVLKWFEAVPQMKMVWILQGDGSDPKDWCQCENCKNFGVSETDRLLRFINVIAKAVRGKYPDKLIVSACYCVTGKPPVNVIPESNVIFAYCICGDLWKDNAYLRSNSNQGGLNEIAAWLKTGYPLGCAIYFPHFFSMVEKIKYFHDVGANGSLLIFPLPDDGLTLYVARKLAWEPEMDVDPLIDRFLVFKYGPASPLMRQFFNLDQAQKFIPATFLGSIRRVDYDSVIKGKTLLEQAESLAVNPDAKKNIRIKKLELLNDYLLDNKSCLLPDDKITHFSQCLAEALKLAKELDNKAPREGVNYPELIYLTTSIDIGDHQPWHQSPVVQKILADPVGMIISNKPVAYEKTAKGLSFKMLALAGGNDTLDYQWQGIPKTKRNFAKSLSRASSAKSNVSTAFELDDVPAQGGTLILEGLDDEKPGRATFKVTINDQMVFDEVNTFSENDWSTVSITVPASVLKKGINTLEITNTTPEKISAVANIYGAKDYHWGWLLLSAIHLDFNSSVNPVVLKPVKIPGSWQKARIDVSAGGSSKGGKKLTVTGSTNWVISPSPAYVYGESKEPLSEKWEEIKLVVVPEEDCNLMLKLNGSYRPEEKGGKTLLPIWAEYDDVRVEGGVLKNGSFEILNDKRLPDGWSCTNENIVIGNGADDGKTYVKACFDKTVTQTFPAKAGQPVTVTVKVRKVKE